MTNKDTIDMTVMELVMEGVKMYIERCGWNPHDENAIEDIADDIHRVFKVAIDYSVVEHILDTKLSIRVVVNPVFEFGKGDL